MSGSSATSEAADDTDSHAKPQAGTIGDVRQVRSDRSSAERASFVEGFDRKARLVPDAVFAKFNGSSLTFADIARDSSTLAAHLTKAGIARGDRVAVMMQNSPVLVKVVMALARAGIVWVPINARLLGEGLRYVLEHADPSAVVCDEVLLPHVLRAGAPRGPSTLFVAGEAGESATSLDTVLAAPVPFEGPVPDWGDDFAIMYTSGTTGRPKGVLVTHAMMSYAAGAVARMTDIGDGDVMFVWEPLYHVGGAQVLLMPVLRDVSLAMVERFSASRFWQQVRASGATHVHYLGGILQILLNQPEATEDHEHRVRMFWGGGCPAPLWRRFEERFGVEIRECYGMTECSSIATANDTGAVGSVGRAMPWFSVEVLDAQGRQVPVGEKGEIVVRAGGGDGNGPIFRGYFRDPETTGQVLRDGVLHTGDLGQFDAASNLFFHGRLADSVRTRGENVSAWEVEHVAANHPDVEDCAMVGVAAEIGEQDIKLFVKLREGRHLEMAELSAWLRARLAPFQVPRYLARVGGFERTSSERIMKHLLSRAPTDEWG